MHELTKQNLDTLQLWMADALRADAILAQLDAVVKVSDYSAEGGGWASLEASFGDNTVRIHEAKSVNEGTPFMAALRKAGFKRVTGPTEDPSDGSVRWQYLKEEGEGVRPVKVAVAVYLPKVGQPVKAGGCRYVEVGVKEVPDIRLMCDEELAAWEATQKA
jgi:hypothetical protein